MPKYAYPADRAVVDALPSSRSSDVVALAPANGCVHASYVTDVRNPASLLNHDRFTDDEAIALTAPFDPVNRKPCPVPRLRLVVLAVWNDE